MSKNINKQNKLDEVVDTTVKGEVINVENETQDDLQVEGQDELDMFFEQVFDGINEEPKSEEVVVEENPVVEQALENVAVEIEESKPEESKVDEVIVDEIVEIKEKGKKDKKVEKPKTDKKPKAPKKDKKEKKAESIDVGGGLVMEVKLPDELKIEKPVKAKKEPKPKKLPIAHEFIAQAVDKAVEDLGTDEHRINEVAVTDKQGKPSPRWRIFTVKSPVGNVIGVDERKTTNTVECVDESGKKVMKRTHCVYTAYEITESGKPLFTKKDLVEIPKFVYDMAVKYIMNNKQDFKQVK